ncbi:TRAP transporter large permease [Gilvimarinus agarilyticus]|uniref:TRAP transporter large permease n=1 Tax=Gilvimarinus sp. 2_MG-2023 TaxID=3062666 RepID=UPI001C08EA12|nr:TRAP transporter large permease [Gilvimarinus sp. 2_MG-2023]MBU2886712.1 TRAP transporter large permease [Gilvimarinus agarilyticus]MDO6571378.1 TRAP transporter large permease [Gilvimarinus sp. 2_MG-2023]
MDISIVILVASFIALLLLNVPVGVSIALSGFFSLLFSLDFASTTTTMAQRMSAGVDSFALLAIPFFILSGFLMGQGGIAHRLIEFAKILVVRLPGGLAFVNILSCTLFGAISGSAVAATSAIGGFVIPEMEKDGYSREFSTAVTVTASTTGMLIPPSNILIVYSLASGGVSIAALFLAGYLPGILVALCLMAASGIYAKMKGYGVQTDKNTGQIAKKTLDALPSLFLVFLVIGGIVSGYFTPTEAGAIAVLYSFVLATFVYKEVKFEELTQVINKSVCTTAIVMLLIAASSAMSWVLSYENIPQSISDFFLGFSSNPIVILLMINVLLLLVGTFLDMTPAVLIFTPIFLPVVEALGISPIHFGIIMILNLSIGLCTPPVGSVLFVGCSIGKTSLARVIPPLLPLYLAMFIALLIIICLPSLSTWLPSVLL